MKKSILAVFIFICMFLCMDKVLAGRGCCSHHGGQAYCSGGRWVCNDGTYSPTCTCSGGASSNSNSSYKRSVTTTIKKVYGCTNSSAINYNSYANVSDGSCKFEKTETSTEEIEYETITNGDVLKGKKKVVTKGDKGEKKIVKKIITNEAGEEVSSEIITEEVTKEPVNEVVEYKILKTTTKNKTTNNINNKKSSDESSNNIIIFEIISIIISAVYTSKNKNANTIISKINKTKAWFRIILYFFYFIFVLPPFIDIVLIIINEIKKTKK